MSTSSDQVPSASASISDKIDAWRSISPRKLSLLLLVFGPFAAFFLSIIPLMIPDSILVANLRNAVEIGQITPANYGPTASGMRVDQWTDCTYFLTGIDPGASVFRRAATNPSNSNCEGLTAALSSTNNIPEPTRLYYRYWFGQLLFLRPLIAILGLGTTRLVVMIALVLFAVLLFRRLKNSAGGTAAGGLILGMMFSGLTWNLPDELVMATSWAALMAAPVAASYLISRPLNSSELFVWAMTSGMFFAFFHHLLNIAIALTLTALYGILAFAPENRKMHLWVTLSVVVSSAGWILGFMWMWVSTWLFAALFEGPNGVLNNIQDQARFRISGEYGTSVERRFGAATEAVVLEWLSQPGAIMFGFIVTALFSVYLARQRTIWFLVSAVLLILLPFSIFEVMSNHSQIHRWGVWQYIPFSLVAALLVLRMGAFRRYPTAAAPELRPSEVRISEIQAVIVSILIVFGGYLLLQSMPSIASWRDIHPSTFSFRLLALIFPFSLAPQIMLRTRVLRVSGLDRG